MCHYLGAGLHGKQKRVKAQSESSKSVVNSVLISREMPVFPGFLEIIRVVNRIIEEYQSNTHLEKISSNVALISSGIFIASIFVVGIITKVKEKR